jgi:hypothetical protein
MPIRNPFRRAGAPEATDDSQRNAAENGFKDATVSGAKPLQMPDSAEYKLSGEPLFVCADGGRSASTAPALVELALILAQRLMIAACISP